MSSPGAGNPIDAVINALADLVEWAKEQPSRIGYFASLYLRETVAIRKRLGTGFFDDDARMAQLDATFASRYLTAVQQFTTGDPQIMTAWSMALNASSRNDLIIVQQLLSSMNPHINLDLAIASVQTCPGASLAGLHDDFMRITSILESTIPTIVSEIGSLSPLMGMLNYLDESGEVAVLNFSMSQARNEAWTWAVQLSGMSLADQQTAILQKNGEVAGLGSKIISPGLILQGTVDLIRSRESGDVAAIIDALDNGNPVITLSS